jgi:hypothetical protein
MRAPPSPFPPPRALRFRTPPPQAQAPAPAMALPPAPGPAPTMAPPPQPLAVQYPYLTALPTTNVKALVSPLSRKLFELPEVRTLVLRSTRKTLEFEGVAGRKNLEAMYAFVRGEKAVTPCTKCTAKSQRSWGPFPECVVPGDLFGGCCCNCWYNANSSRCSLCTNSKAYIDQEGTFTLWPWLVDYILIRL